jgi:hypothetical protein
MDTINIDGVEISLPEINREMVVSSSHISVEEMELLPHYLGNMVHYVDNVYVQPFDYGWRIFVNSELDESDYEKIPHVLPLIKLGLALECKWVILDAGGPILEGLPVFEW